MSFKAAGFGVMSGDVPPFGLADINDASLNIRGNEESGYSVALKNGVIVGVASTHPQAAVVREWLAARAERDTNGCSGDTANGAYDSTDRHAGLPGR